MKPKRTKPVRCWMAHNYQPAMGKPSGQNFIHTRFHDAKISRECGWIVTPGHFVPDEPKRKARRK